MPRALILCCLFALAPMLVARAEDKPADPPKKDDDKTPPALTHYMGREIAQTMHYTGAPWLVRENRERQEECSSLLKCLHLTPGMTVCDMGSGNGFYTLKMAPLVGEKGKILAVDIQPEMLTMLSKRAEASHIENVETIEGTVVDPKLPDGKVDLVFCVDVYHEFDHPVEMLAAIRKSLAPKGRMVLVEFRSEDPNVPIKKLHRMSKAQINKEIPPNGFKLVEEFDKLPWQHVMFFEKE